MNFKIKDIDIIFLRIRLHKDFDLIMYLCIEVVYDNYDYMIADVLHRIRLPDSHNLKRPKITTRRTKVSIQGVELLLPFHAWLFRGC